MPLRPLSRGQAWLLPPSVDDLVAPEHPARFVDMLLEGFDEDEGACVISEFALICQSAPAQAGDLPGRGELEKMAKVPTASRSGAC